MKRSILAICLLAGIASAQVVPMTNDNCGTAIAIADGVNPSAPLGLSGNVYTNLGSTVSTGPAFCAAAGIDVWFSYVATSTTGVTTFSLCTPAGFVAGTNTDSVIQVLDGATCPPTAVLGCDDDSCGPGAGVGARTNACTTIGNTYYVRVAAWNNVSNGTFYITVSQGAGPAIANDDCGGAVPIAYGPNGPFSNAGAVDGCVTSSCGFAAGSLGYRDVWYSIAAACSGPLVVSTDCNGADTQLTAYASCGGAEIACNDDDAAGCGFGSRITFFASQGATYYIRVAAFANALITFNLTVAPGAMGFQMTSPFGPGSIQVDIGGGPLGGQYFFAVTLAPGSFPNGWFYGLDMTVAELAGLINLGPPFFGPLDPTCGAVSIGPVGGAPPITLYAVVLGLPAGFPIPTASTAPVAYTIP